MSVREQVPESKEEYQKYVNNFGFDTSNSFQLNKYYYDSISLMPYALNLYKLSHQSKASPIQIRVYDSEGIFINGYEQCFGDLNKLGILDSFPLKKIKHLPINFNLSLNKDLHLFTNDSILKSSIMYEATRKRYTFIAFYSLWPGYYTEVTLKRLKQHLNTHNSDVQLILVNTSPK
jgi:hypothetical protein